MSIVGKVKTIFSDRDKTEALFPRTKISAVSDDSGTGLDAILEDYSKALEDIPTIITHNSTTELPAVVEGAILIAYDLS